jgi:phosphoglycolate phosphatase
MKYKHLIWDPERYAHIFDFPVKDYYQRAGWDFEREPFLKLSDEFIEEYEHRKLECPLREGAVEVLSRNTHRGIPQSIISAAKQSSVEEMVKWYRVEKLFVNVRGLDNHHAFGKVDIGLQWVSELALPPDQILMVGDTTHDHEVAMAMGVDCILIPSGHQDKLRLEACGARVLDSLSELEF